MEKTSQTTNSNPEMKTLILEIQGVTPLIAHKLPKGYWKDLVEKTLDRRYYGPAK